VLPVMEDELEPGIAEALARTAEQLREDAEAFDEMIHETIEDIVEHAEAGISVSVAALAANPAALRNRIIRLVVDSEFGVGLTRTQTVEVARLVADWTGQGPIDLPGCTARRDGGRIVFSARSGAPRRRLPRPAEQAAGGVAEPAALAARVRAAAGQTAQPAEDVPQSTAGGAALLPVALLAAAEQTAEDVPEAAAALALVGTRQHAHDDRRQNGQELAEADAAGGLVRRRQEIGRAHV